MWNCPVYSKTLVDLAVWIQIILNSDMSYWCCPHVMCSVGRTTSAALRLIHPVKIDLIKSTIWYLFSNPNLHNKLEWTYVTHKVWLSSSLWRKLKLSGLCGCMTILVTGYHSGYLFVVSLVQCHSQSLQALGENRGKSNNPLQVASPFHAYAKYWWWIVHWQWTPQHSRWLCTRDVKLGCGCHFLSPVVLFLSCRAERWTKTIERQFWFLKQTKLVLDGKQFVILWRLFKDF